MKDTFDEYKAKTNEVNENNDLYKGTYVKQTLNQDSHTLTYITFRTLNDLRADVLKDFLNGKIGNYTDSNFIFRTQEFIDSMNSEGAVCTYK